MTAGSVGYLVIDSAGRPGAENMAVDYTLLGAARRGNTYLRLYGWSPPCLSFGRNEPAVSRYERDAIEALGIEVVRRPTGGRAVLHERELTYAVAGPVELFGTLRETYFAIHRMVASALRRLGVAAELAPPVRDRGGWAVPGAGACFSAPVGGEIVVAGRKLVGSAQVRERGAFLQHGSVLLENRQDVIVGLTRGGSAPVRATAISEVLGRPVDFCEAAGAVVEEARAAWPAGLIPAPIPEFRDALRRFQDPGWTWRR